MIGSDITTFNHYHKNVAYVGITNDVDDALSSSDVIHPVAMIETEDKTSCVLVRTST